MARRELASRIAGRRVTATAARRAVAAPLAARLAVTRLAVTLAAVALAGAGCTSTTARPRPSTAPVPFPSALPTKPAPVDPGPVDGSSSPVADPVYPDHGNPAIDVLRYDLDLAWAPARRVLTGRATLTIRVAQPVSEITLDFSDAFTIAAARIDGRGTQATWRGDDLVLAVPRPLAAGARLTTIVEYHGTPRDTPFPGTRSDVPSIGAHLDEGGAVWSMQEPYGAFTWFPCSDQPSDKALYDISITAPSGWTGVSSGALAGTTTHPDGSTTFHWHGAHPAATYLLAFAVDRFERFTETGPHGIPVTYWVRHEDAERMLPVLRSTPRMIEWLERRFGPYPFSTIGVVVVPDRSAMETQAMVSMGPLVGYRGETVLLHELAHQWFGDAVTPSTWRDLWLNEGFATYVEMLYTVDRLGANQAETVRDWHADDQRDRRVAGPPGNYKAGSFADHNVYFGPALMLHAVRNSIGDPRFFAMMHDWVQHHRYATVDRALFVRWLNDHAGEDLTPIVDRWLDSPTTPRL